MVGLLVLENLLHVLHINYGKKMGIQQDSQRGMHRSLAFAHTGPVLPRLTFVQGHRDLMTA